MFIPNIRFINLLNNFVMFISKLQEINKIIVFAFFSKFKCSIGVSILIWGKTELKIHSDMKFEDNTTQAYLYNDIFSHQY